MFPFSLIFLLLILGTSCTFFTPNPPCPPPPSARKPITPSFSCITPTVMPIVPDCSEKLGLCELVDLALLNSPKTRASWYRAKQAATDLGSARGAYLPPIFFQGSWLKTQFPDLEFNIPFLTRETLVTASVSTSYLLFDFGGRNAAIFEASSALDSLCWYYSWDIQSVMLQTIQCYYNFLNACAILEADEATVFDNEIALDAALQLKSAGVESLSDELQARTRLIQSKIVFEQDLAFRNVALATLVQSLGLPPDTPIAVTTLPEEIEVECICEDMARLMQLAKERRSDIKAMRAFVLENLFRIQTTRSQMLPNLTVDAFAGKQSINYSNFANLYSVQFSLNVPIFNSFADINALRCAQAALFEAQANLDDEELSAFLSVLSDYYELIANSHILKYSKTYLEIARENRDVAFANYQAGVSTIIDLIVANQALSLARIQLADAKTNFLTSLANLSYHTGGLKMGDVPCNFLPREYK